MVVPLYIGRMEMYHSSVTVDLLSGDTYVSEKTQLSQNLRYVGVYGILRLRLEHSYQNMGSNGRSGAIHSIYELSDTESSTIIIAIVIKQACCS